LARIFLLSPANAGGERAQLILSDRAKFDLAVQLRTEGAAIGDVFSFVSGLYFRGKLAYAQTFSAPPPGVPGALIITQGAGLVPPETVVDLTQLRTIATVPIDAADARYRGPLERDAQLIRDAAGPDCEFVLLGSIASGKYAEPLLPILGDRLLFPSEFVGRGDMSRGGLMLRCVHAGTELEYTRLAGATRRGSRPPKLPKFKRE
jgi:hypothetical protein